MDALGAPAPDPDSEMFAEIIAGFDTSDGFDPSAAATNNPPALTGHDAEVTEPDVASDPAPAPAATSTSETGPGCAHSHEEMPSRASARLTEKEQVLAVPATLDLEAPPELVIPPPPERKPSMIDWCATAFPHLVWLSVVAGLFGQIYGWSTVFGGGPVGWIVAGIFGGVFEFIMVAASSKGLKDLGLGRSGKQVAVFLTVGTLCAALAFYMTLTHFTGDLAMAGIAAAAATALGYLAHVGVHGFEELDNRRTLQAWKTKAAAIEQELKEREKRLRAEHDAYQSAQRQLRLQQMGAAAPGDPAADTRSKEDTRAAVTLSPPEAKAAPEAGTPVKRRAKRRRPKVADNEGKPQLDPATAFAWAKQNPGASAADVRTHFEEQGFVVPVVRTVQRYIHRSDDTT